MKKGFRPNLRLKRKIEKRDVISIAAIGLFIALIVYLTFEYMDMFGDLSGGVTGIASRMQELILSYGGAGVVVFVLMHALQVVVAAIPAAAVQFVGGAIYGTFGGLITTEIGVLIGSLISFSISRLFGKRIVSLFVSMNTIEKIEGKVASNTSSWVLLAMFIMPGFPKDFLPWVFGLTNFPIIRFHIISAIGRLPAMILATYMGAHIVEGDTTLVIIVTAVTIVLFLLMYLFRNKLFALAGIKTGSGKKTKTETEENEKEQI